jgi:RNase H-like domain found in reverse transcriptase
MSTVLHPLHKLLQLNKEWDWDKKCHKAFEEIKRMIADTNCLTHVDPSLPLTLATDASSYGIGAVLSDVTATGERLIRFASRSLLKAEQNYSQLDHEGLSIVWAVKMSDYLCGRHFTLITDNRPIAAILCRIGQLHRWSQQDYRDGLHF